MLDVDDFSGLNARIGRHGADAVLVELARQLRLAVRTADIACRIGEDEFAVILPESEAGGAELLAKRVARAVAAGRPTTAPPVRVSVGVSDLRPGDHEADLVRRADDALARAKGVVRSHSAAAGGLGPSSRLGSRMANRGSAPVNLVRRTSYCRCRHRS